MREKFVSASRGLYLRPDVHVHVEDGRSFVRRSTDKFQVIQATLVDTWASTAAGAFALSENNLYTTDAFHDYLSHLTDDGVVCFTRWGFEPPRESLRLISLAMAALSQLGERQPWKHVIVGRGGTVEGWGAQDTVLVSRKPLGEAEIARAKALFAAAHMEAVYLPGLDVHNQFRDLLLSPNPAEYQRNYTFDITPSAITARSSSTPCNRGTCGLSSRLPPTIAPTSRPSTRRYHCCSASWRSVYWPPR